MAWVARFLVSVPSVTYLLFLIGWRSEWLKTNALDWLTPLTCLEYISLNCYLEYFIESIDAALVTLEINDEAVYYREEDSETVIRRKKIMAVVYRNLIQENRDELWVLGDGKSIRLTGELAKDYTLICMLEKEIHDDVFIQLTPEQLHEVAARQAQERHPQRLKERHERRRLWQVLGGGSAVWLISVFLGVGWLGNLFGSRIAAFYTISTLVWAICIYALGKIAHIAKHSAARGDLQISTTTPANESLTVLLAQTKDVNLQKAFLGRMLEEKEPDFLKERVLENISPSLQKDDYERLTASQKEALWELVCNGHFDFIPLRVRLLKFLGSVGGSFEIERYEKKLRSLATRPIGELREAARICLKQLEENANRLNLSMNPNARILLRGAAEPIFSENLLRASEKIYIEYT